jgi:hypothetical protein
MLMDKKVKPDWLVKVKAQGWSGAMRTMLDAFEPFAPLISQFLWIVQPMAGLFEAQDMVHDLANILDSKDGIEVLRQALDEE